MANVMTKMTNEATIEQQAAITLCILRQKRQEYDERVNLQIHKSLPMLHLRFGRAT